MAITHVKIHPAIGVARVGNSPEEFFIGPERLWEPLDPPGGFKDDRCRVKRQAARFRVFAYHDDGSETELTAAEAEISWTVHLVNKKAVPRNQAPVADMIIDPGPRTLKGPNQRQELDNGRITFPGTAPVTVPLGEIRTDDEGHLLVLGGFGTSASPTGTAIGGFYSNPGWYDDVADGPVIAHVTLLGSGTQLVAAGAWVIVGPPKFAPQLENVITLYDKLFELAAAQEWVEEPAVPSYTHDIYPILQRARGMRWVINVAGSHGWADPAYDPGLREAIFNKLANPDGGAGGNMPLLNDATLTRVQYSQMQKWAGGNFTPDWSGPPGPAASITAEDLDRAALNGCVGAGFYPGIEAGGITAKPILAPENYVGASDPLRPNHSTLSAGDLTEYMAIPWQADFFACGANWWPVPRPYQVTPQGTGTAVAWARDVGSYAEMVNEWHTLGFVIRQGDQYLEVDRCDTTFITLLTPHVDFRDVAQGPMGMSRQATMAIAFEVRSPGAAVTLEVQPGDGPAHPRLTLNPASDVTPATQGNEIATATLGVHYETGPAGEVVSDQVTVTHVESNRTWTVTITASTVGRRPAAAALVLDRSGSMAEDRGDGQSKHEALKEAASLFVDLMLDGDAVALVRHDDEAHVLRGLTPLDPAALVDPKLTLKNLIAGPELAPSGPTSIGDGIFAARQVLNGAGREYGVKALVVLTDGIENRPRWISEVAPEINERTYAVGLGTPDNTSVPMLQAIAGNHGGYMLVTGPVTGDNRFVLQKYFLQILAGINQADVVLDPDGALVAGPEQEIPFTLTEADTGVDVVLLTPDPEAVDFRLQTPNGFVIEPWRAKDETSMRWVSSTGMACYRLVLPAEIVPARYDQAGTWRILLSVGKPKLSAPEAHAPTVEVAHVDVSGIRLEEVLRRVPPSRAPDLSALAPDRALSSVAVPGGGSPIPYSVGVYAYSDVSLQASITQSGFEPGGAAGIEAVLTEAGKPNGFDASVWAEVTRPDGSQATVALKPTEKGRFTGSFPTPISGVYKCRVRASGRSRHGYPFQRETTLTAVVWLGGDRQPDPADVALRKCLAAQCDPGKEKEPGKKVVGKIGPEKALDEAEKIKDEAEKIKDEAEKIKDEAEKIKDEAKKYRDEAKKHRDEAKKHRDEAKREKPVQPMDEAPKPDVTDAQPVPDE